MNSFENGNQKDYPVKFLRCDNAGENKSVEKAANGRLWKLNLTFEYTARHTPQQNHLAELGLATLANRARAMLIRANIPVSDIYDLFKYAAVTAAKLYMLSVVEIDGVCVMRCLHWSVTVPKFAKHLRTWGEAGTVTLKTDSTPKPKDRGVHCMFIGYSLMHDGDCYHMKKH